MEIINEATASPKPTLRELLATGHQITLHATQEIKRFSTGMFDVINRNIKTYLPPIVDSTAQGVARLFEDKSGNNIVGDMATGVGGYFGEMAYNTLPPIMKDAITGWKKLMDKGEDTSLINSSPDDTQEIKIDDDDLVRGFHDSIHQELTGVTKSSRVLPKIEELLHNSNKFESLLLNETKNMSSSPERIQDLLESIKQDMDSQPTPVNNFRDKEKEEIFRNQSLDAMDKIYDALMDKALLLQSTQDKNSSQNGSTSSSMMNAAAGFGLGFLGKKIKNTGIGRALSRVTERVSSIKNKMLGKKPASNLNISTTQETTPKPAQQIESQSKISQQKDSIKPQAKQVDVEPIKEKPLSLNANDKPLSLAKEVTKEAKPSSASKIFKGFGRAAKSAAKSLPIIGAAVSLLSGGAEIASVMNDENLSDTEKKEELIKTGGGIAGSSAGAAIGGVVGAIGGPLGVALGSALGGFIGDWLGRKGGEVVANTSAEQYDKNIEQAKNSPERTNGLDLTSALDNPEVQDALDTQSYMLHKKDDLQISGQQESVMVPVTKTPNVEERNDVIRKHPTTSAKATETKKEQAPQVINNTPVTNVTNNYVNQGGSQGQRDKGSVVIPMPINVASGNGFGMMTR